MSKKLKRMICFIAAFALAFIAVKPIDVKAVNVFELTVAANDDGSVSVTDSEGVSMNDYQIGEDYWWGFDYMGPEGFTPSGAYENGAMLGNFNWKLPLMELGAPAGDYALVISLLTSGEGGRTVVVAQGLAEITYTATANYTVVFDSSDFSGSYVGTTVSTQKLSGDKSPVLPDAPVRDGYDFDGWYLYSMALPAYGYSATNPDGCTAENKFGTAELRPLDGAVYTFRANWTAKAVDPAPDVQKEYKILEGGDQTITQGSGKDLVVRADGELAACTGIFVDGEAFEDSTITAGSTIVTIKAAVLDKMAVGTHKLTFAFKDGVATTTFTLKAAEKTTEVTTEASTAAPATVTTTEAAKTTTTNTASPKTGDEGIMIYGILMLLSLAGMVGMSLKKKDN